jgi:hypothetical protein
MKGMSERQVRCFRIVFFYSVRLIVVCGLASKFRGIFDLSFSVSSRRLRAPLETKNNDTKYTNMKT